MNKLISFRDLIDLEPKPKRINYDNTIFEWNGLRYKKDGHTNITFFIDMYDMKEPNIEIIEEEINIGTSFNIQGCPICGKSVIGNCTWIDGKFYHNDCLLEEDKPLIEEIDIEKTSCMYQDTQVIHAYVIPKINELVRYINSKGDK